MYYSTQQQQIRSLDMEVDNYKKSIIKEEERNEELTMLLNKINADISHISKQIETSASKRDQLKAEYIAYTRALQETEQSLAKAVTVSRNLVTRQLHSIFLCSVQLHHVVTLVFGVV